MLFLVFLPFAAPQNGCTRSPDHDRSDKKKVIDHTLIICSNARMKWLVQRKRLVAGPGPPRRSRWVTATHQHWLRQGCMPAFKLINPEPKKKSVTTRFSDSSQQTGAEFGYESRLQEHHELWNATQNCPQPMIQAHSDAKQKVACISDNFMIFESHLESKLEILKNQVQRLIFCETLTFVRALTHNHYVTLKISHTCTYTHTHAHIYWHTQCSRQQFLHKAHNFQRGKKDWMFAGHASNAR